MTFQDHSSSQFGDGIKRNVSVNINYRRQLDERSSADGRVRLASAVVRRTGVYARGDAAPRRRTGCVRPEHGLRCRASLRRHRREADALRVQFHIHTGYDNLCLFNRFAHGTSLLAPTLRKQVCGFINVNRRSGMHGTNRTVAEFVLEDGSSMQSLSREHAAARSSRAPGR
jgi:hypothetical protein